MCKRKDCEWNNLCPPGRCTDDYPYWGDEKDYHDSVKDHGRFLIAVCSCGLRVYNIQTMNHHRGKHCHWVFVKDFKLTQEIRRKR